MSSLSNKVIKKCDNCSNFLVTLKRGKKKPTSGDVRYTSHFQLSHPHSLRHLFFTMQPPYLVACPPYIPRTSPAPPPFPLLHFYYHISLPPPPSWCSHNLTHSIFSPPFLFLRRFQHLTICCTRTRSSAVLIFYLCFDVSLTHTLENQNYVNKATADSLWEITALLFWSKCG